MLPLTNKSLPLRSPNTVAIGVTGHRFLQDIEALLPAIDAVLNGIQARWPNLPLTIISSLAEGADRLVAQRALDLFDARLIVPLPMTEDEYIGDFEHPGSDEEFRSLLSRATKIVHLPREANRPAAYASAGDYLLAQSDILVALWDGQEANGHGGTATVVAEARRMTHPLVWISACNGRPGSPKPGRKIAQGSIFYENF